MKPEPSDTSKLRLLRDPLLDRIVVAAAAIAFTIGAWQFTALASEVKAMSANLSVIARDAAVSAVNQAATARRIEDHETRIRVLETGRKP